MGTWGGEEPSSHRIWGEQGCGTRRRSRARRTRRQRGSRLLFLAAGGSGEVTSPPRIPLAPWKNSLSSDIHEINPDLFPKHCAGGQRRDAPGGINSVQVRPLHGCCDPSGAGAAAVTPPPSCPVKKLKCRGLKPHRKSGNVKIAPLFRKTNVTRDATLENGLGKSCLTKPLAQKPGHGCAALGALRKAAVFLCPAESTHAHSSLTCSPRG